VINGTGDPSEEKTHFPNFGFDSNLGNRPTAMANDVPRVLKVKGTVTILA
jgi:hypothetical protein